MPPTIDTLLYSLQTLSVVGLIILVFRDGRVLASGRICRYGLATGFVLLLAGFGLLLLDNLGWAAWPHGLALAASTSGLMTIGFGLSRLTAEANQKDRHLEASEPSLHLEIALDLIDQGFVIWNEQNQLLACNKKYQEFMGYPDRLMQSGTSLFACIFYQAQLGTYGSGDPDVIAQDQYQKIIGERDAGDVTVTTASGTILFVRRYYVPGYGHITTQTDITKLKSNETKLIKNEEMLRRQVLELRDREERLENQAETLVSQAKKMDRARRELEVLNAEKDKLFSIIAHDLRGPFASLVSVTELLANRDNQLDDDEVAHLHLSLHQEGQNLFKLLENLLEWSLLQQNATIFNPEVLPLEPLVRSTFALYGAVAKEKNIRLRTGVLPKAPVLTDENMAHTVLRNLVHNALKFTPDGGQVSVSADADNEWMWISISDTGIGICKDRIITLFEINAGKSTPGTDGEVGSGLGLHLCCALVKKCGGSIHVKSQAGKGSTFQFSLPLA